MVILNAKEPRKLLLILCGMILVGVCRNDQGHRKTYLIRYLNRDVTIPVTVVVDYKKQAEYVISTNPRTPTKSVTFYDFTQRTIVYKDMSNSECFIGRLTNESIEEENKLLSNIKNPVNVTITTLKLEPFRSSLTPTEVRNIAGQKVAMFCRKMTTWLLQTESTTNKRHRRQVDRNNLEKLSPSSPTFSSHERHQVGSRNLHRDTLDLGRKRSSRRRYSHNLYRGHKEFSHPLTSSVQLNPLPSNPDAITFHQRHETNLHHRGHNSYKNDRFLDSLLYNSHADNYTYDLRHSASNQFYPRRDVNIQPLPTNNRNRYSPRHFEFTHQLRSEAHTNPNRILFANNINKDRTSSKTPIQHHPLQIVDKHFEYPVALQTEVLKTYDIPNIANSDKIQLINHDPRKKVLRASLNNDLENAFLDTVNISNIISDTPAQFKLDVIEETYSKGPNARFYDSDEISKDNSDQAKDVPEEVFEFSPLAFENNQSQFYLSNHSNNSTKNITIQEGIPSQIRFQTPLKLFSPDEIVIDLTNIPELESFPKTRSHSSERQRVSDTHAGATIPRDSTKSRKQSSSTLSPLFQSQNRNSALSMSTGDVVHQQRHRRKKLKKSQRCCPHLDATAQPCCGSRDRHHATRNNPPRQPQSPQHLCDIKKMCRTLYRSTQAVKICKINELSGC